MRFWKLLIPLIVTTFIFRPAAILAQSVEEFYNGKTISFMVSSAAGGSYDLMSRTIARHLPRYLPGSPTVVVRNQPGAGGIIAANLLYNNVARDGTVIGGLQGNVPFEPMLGVKEATFDPRKFIWLGTPSVETCVLTVWAASGRGALADLRGDGITVASTGVNSNPSVSARLVNELFGTNMRPVVGYVGMANSMLAIENREVDGHACILWAALQSLRPAWVAEKKVVPMLQWGAIKEPGLPNVPFAMDLLKSEDDRLLLEAASAPLALGRPFLLPPGVPKDRAAAMQAAFMSVFADKEFNEEVKKQQLEVNSPRSGAEVLALIERIYAMPQPVVSRLQRLSVQ
jgi:tripartite-type tricarboxylate transporter receptor subunit TctC